MENMFVVPVIQIDTGWMFCGFAAERYGLEYSRKRLGIPKDNIVNAALVENGHLEIILKVSESAMNETWYKQLERISVRKESCKGSMC